MAHIPVLPVPGSQESVSALCLGMADYGSRVDDEQAWRMMDGFADRGGTFFDVAHIYAFWAEGCLGRPERILGEWAKARSLKGLTLATKGGHSSVGAENYPRPDDFLNPSQVAQDLTESLDRLQVSQIDLYYLHRDDPRVPVGEIMEMTASFVAQGKVKWLGASNWSVDRLREANAYADAKGLPRFRFLQNQWSLAHPNWPNNGVGDVRFLSEPDEAPLSQLDVIAAPWSPNAAGWFAGKNAWGGDYENPGNQAARAKAQEAAKRLGLPLSTVALAWLLHRGVPVSPILGTGSLVHLDEAVAAFGVPPEEVADLRAPR